MSLRAAPSSAAILQRAATTAAQHPARLLLQLRRRGGLPLFSRRPALRSFSSSDAAAALWPSFRSSSSSPRSLRPAPGAAAAGRHCRSMASFESESDFHACADSALDAIQDGLDAALESSTNPTVEYELSSASGVLTLSLPPHGTWVLNKQTPNRQIWWSSPLSGPKRFEYVGGDDGGDGDGGSSSWYSTKDGLALGPLLVQEVRHVHPHLPDFSLDV